MKERRKPTHILAGMLISAAILTGCNSTEPDEAWKYETDGDYQKLTEAVKQTTVPTQETTSPKTTTAPEPERPFGTLLSDFFIEEVGDFHNGIARIKISKTSFTDPFDGRKYVNGRYGYINKQGEIVLSPGSINAPEIFEAPVCLEYTDLSNNNSSYITYKTESGQFPSGFSFGDYPASKYTSCTFFGTQNGFFRVETTEKSVGVEIHTTHYHNSTGKKAFYVEQKKEDSLSGATYTTTYYTALGEVISSRESAFKRFANYGDFNKFGYILFADSGDNYNATPIAKIYVINKEGKEIELTLNEKITSFKDIPNPTSLLTPNFLGFCHIGTIKDQTIFQAKTAYASWVKNNDSLGYHTNYVYYIIDYDLLQFVPIGRSAMATVNSRVMDFEFSHINILNNYIVYANNSQKIYTYDKYFSTLKTELSALPEFKDATIKSIKVHSNDLITIILKSSANTEFSSIISVLGEVILPPTLHINLSTKYTYSDGHLPAKDASTGKWGYINEAGEWAIQPQFDSVRNFSDGLACVNENSFIDTTGKVLFTFNQ